MKTRSCYCTMTTPRTAKSNIEIISVLRYRRTVHCAWPDSGSGYQDRLLSMMLLSLLPEPREPSLEPATSQSPSQSLSLPLPPTPLNPPGELGPLYIIATALSLDFGVAVLHDYRSLLYSNLQPILHRRLRLWNPLIGVLALI